MPTLDDVTNFAVDSDCLFTWDSVTDATSYEIRYGVDYDTGVTVNSVPVTVTDYQLSANDPTGVDYHIKALADGFDESALAATVSVVAAPVLTDPVNVTIVNDEITFDLVPDATSYEIRLSQGYPEDPSDSQLVSVVSDNTPLLIANNAGKRFYVRAFGPCLSSSPGYGSFFSQYNTNDDCGQNEGPNEPNKIRGTLKKEITATAYTVEETDIDYLIEYNNAAAGVITIPAGLPVQFTFSVVQTGAGAATIATADPGSNIVNSNAGAAVATAQTAGIYAAITATQLTSGAYLVAGEVA